MVAQLRDGHAMKPEAMPGENMRVKIIKPGEGTGQGVGYLDDGTMVVVDNARSRPGQFEIAQMAAVVNCLLTLAMRNRVSGIRKISSAMVRRIMCGTCTVQRKVKRSSRAS